VSDHPLSASERLAIAALASHSTHPLAAALRDWAVAEPVSARVRAFREHPGRGLAGEIGGQTFQIGSAQWLSDCGVHLATDGSMRAWQGPADVFVAINGRLRGSFRLKHRLHPAVKELLPELNREFKTTLLSGDSERDHAIFVGFFNSGLHFSRKPVEKLDFVKTLQQSGATVLMVGDGLNDAGALKQSDIGVAVVERAGCFSPASDVIIPTAELGRLAAVLRLARSTVKIVRLSFGISALYNAAGISIGAAGVLSPLICAVLMPLSSVSVVLFACGATRRAAARAGLLS